MTLQTPQHPVGVLVRETPGWTLAELVAWRWINPASRAWEGLVEFGGGREQGWIDSDNLRRVAASS